MKSAREIIIAPVITEASTDAMFDGHYTFKVARDATKPEIRRAVEELFEVKVLKVNTQNVSGKKKRMGYGKQGKTAAWKKAVVKIDLNPETQTYLASGGKEEEVERKYKTEIDTFGYGQ